MKLRTILIVLIAGAVGYLLGSRAGRGPYEEMSKNAHNALNSRGVKKAVREAKRDLKRAARKVTR